MSEAAENVHQIENPLQPRLQPLPSAVTPMEMLGRAVQQGATPELLEKLMALNDRWEAGNARKAFEQALAQAKSEIPVITKNKKGHNNKYADFAAIASVVDPILGKHGLSYRFRTNQTDKISVTCVLFGHGYSEENTLTAPMDGTTGKNPIQAIGSTLTYLQRYSLVQALGLAAADDDDGKSASAPEAVSQEQLGELTALMESVGADKARFLRFFKIEHLKGLPASRYQEAVTMLNAKSRG